MKPISKKLARITGNTIGIDWEKIDLDQFHKGLQVELEHGSKLGKKTNITKDDLVVTGRIALAHLEEIPDYYTRLKSMEAEADKPKNKKLKEADVIDLDSFRKEKHDREDYYNFVLVSTDGKFIFNPDDYMLVELTHRDQADALIDADLDKAVELGAEVTPLSPTTPKSSNKDT